MAINNSIKNAAASIDYGRIAERVGVPFAILLVVLLQLEPKIDRGIQIADHVDAELTYLAQVGCAPPPRVSLFP